MDDGEVNAWIERLVRGASTLPLSQLGLPLLADLAMSLAQRAWSFSSYLASLPPSSPENSGLIPDSWLFGTSSFSEPAAESAPSSDTVDDTLSMDDAMAAAERLRRNE
jgi:hypothetical protein